MKQSQFLQTLKMLQDSPDLRVGIDQTTEGWVGWMTTSEYDNDKYFHYLEAARGELRIFKNLEPLVSLLRHSYHYRINLN